MTAKASLAVMHAAHGVTVGQTCGTCVSLLQTGSRSHPAGNGRISEFGCRVFRRDHSHATRWARKWAACGAWKGTE